MKIIEVSGVTKKFHNTERKEICALSNVNLEIEEGEIFAVLGPNGAGKTTLLNVMMGILLPDSGFVSICGKNAGNAGVMENVGFVSGEERFHYSLTCSDIMNFGAIIRGVRNRKPKIDELAGIFNLGKVMDSKFDMLSTGERIKLAFAYALLNEPKILVLDEPTLGMDPDISIKIRKHIKRINRELGTTIVLTSHYMKEVEYLSERVAFINKGIMMDIDSIKGIRRKYPDLEKYFVEMAKHEAK